MKTLSLEILEAIIAEELEIYLHESRNRERIPGCSKGNPYHDLEGRFTDPETSAGSWSLRNASSRSDCQAGQAQRPNQSRKQLFSRIKCGRDSRYRCKDRGKTPKWEGQIRDRFPGNEDIRAAIRAELACIIALYEDELEKQEQNLMESPGDRTERMKHYCSKMGLISVKDYLVRQNLLTKASKGELGKKAK